MALNIRNHETEKLASDLAALTGETKTEAVTKALREHLALLKRRRIKRCLADSLDEIAKHCAPPASLVGRLLQAGATVVGSDIPVCDFGYKSGSLHVKSPSHEI